ncbi:hypothetical protein BpHYR1_044972 [Brachionus plicatilis]|uniref:Uncharacterized protein n=1 Tax=Brachionus plicatilis TaxID=10195 RepID=A0A3M7Q673_BRAPC|nr:hypothetical protein BpHYR1_044972 [Brachionus plicatilis]
MHQEALNKLKLLTVSNRLFELSERYVRERLSHSVPLVVRLVEEYKKILNQILNNKILFILQYFVLQMKKIKILLNYQN